MTAAGPEGYSRCPEIDHLSDSADMHRLAISHRSSCLKNWSQKEVVSFAMFNQL